MPETFATTIRLTEADRLNVEKLVRSGAATNSSEAIRVALAIASRFMAKPAEVARMLQRDAAESKGALVARRGSAPGTSRSWSFFDEQQRLEIAEYRDHSKVALTIEDVQDEENMMIVTLTPEQWEEFKAAAEQVELVETPEPMPATPVVLPKKK